MTKTLTLRRSSPRDLIIIPLWVFNPDTEHGHQIAAQLDTGNDHTCLRQDVLDRIGATPSGRSLPVHGVTGSSSAQVTRLTLGFRMDGNGTVTVDRHEVAVLLHMSCEALLGRDILEWFDMTISRNGVVTITSD
ncbi:retroviral-like aspartic protease family protein [Mesorhizobium sp. CN5-321]|uniref:retroviral-like aspartic protease family protein n=1 Tax=Mesorhizobium hunchu TaxID=3157708 RepID=UPI0032B75652